MKSLSLRGGVLITAATAASLLFLFLCAPPAFAADWSRVDFADQFVSKVVAAPSNNRTVYAVSSGDASDATRQLDASFDGGATWVHRTLPGFIFDIAVDPADDKTIYLASQGLYRSRDGGATWAPMHGTLVDPLLFAVNFKLITVAPSDHNLIYAESQFGQIVRSRDGGATWEYMAAVNFANGLALVVDPRNPTQVWAGATGGLYRSRDGGDSWQLSTTQQWKILSLAIDPVDSHKMYMTGNDHIWRSLDGGDSWQDFGGGYYASPDHPRQTGQIVISPADHDLLYLADDGYFFKQDGGIWRSEGGGDWEKLAGFDQNVFTLAVSMESLWIGARNGLYRNQDLQSKPPAQGIKRPVVVIPGILGSWNFGAGWTLDPFFHTYDPLLDSLRQAGYEDNKTLFTFPYEWRDSAVINGPRLAAKIAEIRAETGSDKVDLVAHSMGGLVARQYVESDAYQNDVGQLIFLATPQRGAPMAYKALEAGDFAMSGWQGVLEQSIFAEEAKFNGYSDTLDYLRNKIASAPELLPDYAYLRELPSLAFRPQGAGYPLNPLLGWLNGPEGLSRLAARVSASSIVGEDGLGDTISDYRTGQASDLSRYLWPHGEPDGYPGAGIGYGEGDGTVPLSSAAAFVDTVTSEPATHGGILLAGRSQVVKALTGAAPSSPPSYLQVRNILLIEAHSPVRLELTTPSGQTVSLPGPSPSAGGAFYTGWTSGFQAISVPDPAPGVYRIKVVGVAAGPYHIDAKFVADGANPLSSTEVGGYIRAGASAEFTAAVTQNSVSAPVATDTDPPTSSLFISGAAGQNGWLTSAASVGLAATDGGSGVSRTLFQIDDGPWVEYGSPVAVSSEGVHSFNYYSEDYAGNREQVRSAPLKIDTTPPFLSASVPTILLRQGSLSPNIIAGDTISGLATIAELVDGRRFSGAIDLSTLPLGLHTVSATATDLAGNAASLTRSFDLETNPEATANDVILLVLNSQIVSTSAQIVLPNDLEDAMRFKGAGKPKQYYDKLKDFRQHASNLPGVSPLARARLIEDADYLLAH